MVKFYAPKDIAEDALLNEIEYITDCVFPYCAIVNSVNLMHYDNNYIRYHGKEVKIYQLDVKSKKNTFYFDSEDRIVVKFKNELSEFKKWYFFYEQLEKRLQQEINIMIDKLIEEYYNSQEEFIDPNVKKYLNVS